MKRASLITSVEEMPSVREAWQRLYLAGDYSIFQDFSWNEAAAQIFRERESPLIACVETGAGCAIVPACIDASRSQLRLIGETLFDYRTPIAVGDPDALRQAWQMVLRFAAQQNLAFVMESFAGTPLKDDPLWSGFETSPFTTAPCVRLGDGRWRPHAKLERNMRRLLQAGCVYRKHRGDEQAMLNRIYALKAAQPRSLFADPLRVSMIAAMAALHPEACEIFTLEHESKLVAALVTFLDRRWRRFYTTYYDETTHWAKHSPGLALIHSVVIESLENGLDCDFMTGEQAYKDRLATSSVPLLRVSASKERIQDMAAAHAFAVTSS